MSAQNSLNRLQFQQLPRKPRPDFRKMRLGRDRTYDQNLPVDSPVVLLRLGNAARAARGEW